MLVERGMDFVVEVVQERDDAPELLVLVEMPGVPRRGGFDSKCMATESLALRVLRERLPGPFSFLLHCVGRLPRCPRPRSSAARPNASGSKAAARCGGADRAAVHTTETSR